MQSLLQGTKLSPQLASLHMISWDLGAGKLGRVKLGLR